MSAVRPGCLAAGRRLGSRRFAAKHTQARGHALAWLRPDAPASQLARPTDAGFRHAHRRAASHLTAAHLPAPPAPPSREGGTCSSRPFGPRGHASAFASMSSAPPCRGRHVPHGHLRSHGDSLFALPHVLRAPQRGGRHVPHGHLESHGDYTFALPHVLFVTVTFPPRRLWPHPSPAFGDTTPLEGRIRRRAARCFGSRVNGRSSCRNNPSGVTLPYVWATRAHAPIHVNAPFKPAAPNAGGMKFVPSHHRTPAAHSFPYDSSQHITAMCSRCRMLCRPATAAHPLRRGPERCLRHAGSGALRPGMMGLPGGRRAERFTTGRPRRVDFDPEPGAAK